MNVTTAVVYCQNCGIDVSGKNILHCFELGPCQHVFCTHCIAEMDAPTTTACGGETFDGLSSTSLALGLEVDNVEIQLLVWLDDHPFVSGVL